MSNQQQPQGHHQHALPHSHSHAHPNQSSSSHGGNTIEGGIGGTGETGGVNNQVPNPNQYHHNRHRSMSGSGPKHGLFDTIDLSTSLMDVKDVEKRLDALHEIDKVSEKRL